MLLWAGSAGAGELRVAQQCEKARIEADMKYASCIGKAKLEGIKGRPEKEEARLARCDSKHAERLRRAEARAERKGGSCSFLSSVPVTERTEGPSWLMVQDSGSLSFDFDVSIDEGCPAEAFWSGTMTMGDADPETLWFSDRPHRLAFTQTTDEFVAGFGTTFTASTGGDPNAVLNWQDPADDAEKHAVLELRYVAGTSPQYDGDAGVLTYSVCGLRLDDPDTLQPLPESEQVEPPESVSSIGNITLFIDPAAGYGGVSCAGCPGFPVFEVVVIGGLPEQGPTSSYNCFVGGLCAQAASYFPPGATIPTSTDFLGTQGGDTFEYANVYDGHTQGTEPALGGGCNTFPGDTLWTAGKNILSPPLEEGGVQSTALLWYYWSPYLNMCQ